MDDPDADGSEEAGQARVNAGDAAARWLLVTPVFIDEEFWAKWEVLDKFVSDDAIQGGSTDNRAVWALGCLKADLLSLGIGSGQ